MEDRNWGQSVTAMVFSWAPLAVPALGQLGAVAVLVWPVDAHRGRVPVDHPFDGGDEHVRRLPCLRAS